MAQHEWKTRAELEQVYDRAGVNPLGMPDFGCARCGAAQSLKPGQELPAEGCLDFEGGALPA